MADDYEGTEFDIEDVWYWGLCAVVSGCLLLSLIVVPYPELEIGPWRGTLLDYNYAGLLGLAVPMFPFSIIFLTWSVVDVIRARR